MDRKFMKEAIKEARLAGERGEVPVGAVIVKEGEIIAPPTAVRKNRTPYPTPKLRQLISPAKN